MIENLPSTVTPAAPATSNADLIKALAIAQGKFQVIVKNREVSIKPRESAAYKFRYADLEEILRKTRPALADNGLAVSTLINDGLLICLLMHESGQMLTSTMPMPTLKDVGFEPKRLGATIMYFRRYMISSMLGVASDDDADEQADHPDQGSQDDHQVEPKGAIRPPQKKARPADEPATDPKPQAAVEPEDRPVTVGEAAYLGNKLKGGAKDLAEVCKNLGFDAPDSPAGLSLSQFNAIKKAL